MDTTIKRVCMGPRNEDLDALGRRLQDELDAANARADFIAEHLPEEAERLRALAQGLGGLQERIAAAREVVEAEGQTATVSRILPHVASASDRHDINAFSRQGCGQDWNEVLAELPADGRTKFVRCPNCGRKAHSTVFAAAK